MKRSHKDFIKLVEELRHQEKHESFPHFSLDVPATVDRVEKFLTSAIEFYGEGIWNAPTFLSFLDENPEKSSITKIKLRRMSEQVCVCWSQQSLS